MKKKAEKATSVFLVVALVSSLLIRSKLIGKILRLTLGLLTSLVKFHQLVFQTSAASTNVLQRLR